ncbi:hypothetical protein [Solemya elarraichensis gill symbiont]|uniref:Uncharacterized protein n=1 Tax=Solemya elarraichensis gill symbiont TaxID=1918949 RepID=A0A1T2LC78_9GAMM|nr:hypothetical protein [Solemya elarraichensis gill symbiont]OOZ42703.1 hypothetical protein BOW52_01860 [Solemya elarraichensis gill symbiont]
MEIIGYIGYAALVILAIIWAVGVRTQLGAGVHTVLGSLYFVVGAVGIPLLGIDMLHTLWVILVGFLFAGIIAPVLMGMPGLSWILGLVAGMYSGAVRVGISRQEIEKAQADSVCETVNDYMDKQE